MQDKIKVGAIIVDGFGRRGVVTEVPDLIHSWERPGFFARPIDSKYIETMDVPGIGSANVITATYFYQLSPGVYTGKWVDSRLADDDVKVRLAS